MNQISFETGSKDNHDNSTDWRKLLTARRASLIQQAEALVLQRRAILSEVGEIERALSAPKEGEKEGENVTRD